MTAIAMTNLACLLALTVAVWFVSVGLKDASIVDPFWGIGFVVVAWMTHVQSVNNSPRAWLVCLMVTVWGLRLSVHLLRRNLGHGEDYRYRAMRDAHGPRFWIVSLGTVFLLQGVLIWLISLPVQFAQAPGVEHALSWLDAAGLVAWVVGLTFEWTADVQLARFKRSPSSAGAVLDSGVWRYSRHPNYFGNFLLWWGIGLVGVSSGAWWTVVGPGLLTVLLLKVSGVSLLESTIAERRPAYSDYARRTSAFVPWFPRPGHPPVG